MAKDREKVYEFVEIDDRTPIQKLKIVDQVRVLLREVLKDPSQDLVNDDAVTSALMTLKADFFNLVLRSTEPIRRGERKKVKIRVSSRFNPVIDEVLESKRFKPYYDIDLIRPDIEYKIDYFMELRMKVK